MGMEEVRTDKCPISKEFLEKILKKEVLDFKTSGGSNPGDNYTSILTSLEVVLADDKENPLYLLFKTFPNHPTRQKLLEDTNLFLKEFQVYDIWLPELIRFQKTLIRNEKILVPAMPELVAGAAIDYVNDCSSSNPILSNFILMVDVRKTHGFQMANKLKSLGYHHVKVVLKELAKFHALGYAYKVHHNLTSIHTKFPFLDDPFFTNPSQQPTLEAMFKMNMELVTDSCRDFLEARPEIKKSLDEYKEPQRATECLNTFLNSQGMDEEKVESMLRVKPTKFCEPPLKHQWIIPGHGDCWTNNMLFKANESGQVTEAVLVDLQIARESCVMADIVYFLYTSTDTDFRKQYLNEMLHLYYKKFLDYCAVLKVEPFPGFTLDNFQRKFHRSKIFGFLFASLVLPIILQRPETTVNMDSLEVKPCDYSSPTDEFADMFQKMGRDEDDNKLLRERFTKMAEELYDEGVL